MISSLPLWHLFLCPFAQIYQVGYFFLHALFFQEKLYEALHSFQSFVVLSVPFSFMTPSLPLWYLSFYSYTPKYQVDYSFFMPCSFRNRCIWLSTASGLFLFSAILSPWWPHLFHCGICSFAHNCQVGYSFWLSCFFRKKCIWFSTASVLLLFSAVLSLLWSLFYLCGTCFFCQFCSHLLSKLFFLYAMFFLE